jgi:ribosomal biogenesis protein LAS1
LAGWEKSGRAEELVRGWKRVMKARVREREVGEETESAREKRGIMRELEGEEEGEVLEALCGQEGLVPVGRK